MVLAVLTGQLLGAGPYDSKPVTVERAQWGSLQSEINGMVQGRAPADQAKLRQYVSGFLIPRMTQPDDFDRLPRLRGQLLRDIRMASNPEVSQSLTRLALEECARLIDLNANFHPAVKTNAVMILGELNEDQGSLTGQQPVPPKPLTQALGVLYKAWGTPNQPDYVKMPVLLGFLRHARLSRFYPMHQQAKPAIINEMLKLVNEKQPPVTRTTEGHDWMRRRAMQVLAALGATDPKVVSALDGIVQDVDESVKVRCTAAESLGMLPLEQGALDPVVTGKALGQLVVQVTREVIDHTKEQMFKQTAYGGYGGGYGGASPGYGTTSGSGRSPTYGYGPQQPSGGYPSYGRGGATGPQSSPTYGYGPPQQTRRGRGSRTSQDDQAVELDEYGMPKQIDPLVEPTRRRLKALLQPIRIALAGPPKADPPTGLVRVVTQDSQKSILETVFKSMQVIDRQLNMEDPTIAGMMNPIIIEMRKLADFVGQELAPEEEETMEQAMEAAAEAAEAAQQAAGPQAAGGQPGAAQPGTAQPGTAQPGPGQPSAQPGAPQPQGGPQQPAGALQQGGVPSGGSGQPGPRLGPVPQGPAGPPQPGPQGPNGPVPQQAPPNSNPQQAA
jgi:hypothetical protein